MANQEEERTPSRPTSGSTPEHGSGSEPASGPEYRPSPEHRPSPTPETGTQRRPRAPEQPGAARRPRSGSAGQGAGRAETGRAQSKRSGTSRSGAGRAAPTRGGPAARPAGGAGKPARRGKGQASAQSLPREIRARARDTWNTVSSTAEEAVRRTAKTTRKTASIIGLKFRKAARRRSLQELYRALGELYYQASKSGKIPGTPDARMRELTGEADRVHREIAELERKEEATRRG